MSLGVPGKSPLDLGKGTPPKFNSEFTPEKWMVGKPLSYWVSVTFQGLC